MSARVARATTSRSMSPRWRAVHEQQGARFHRERDRRRLLAMARALVSSALLVVLVLGVVASRVQLVRLSYRLDGLRTLKAEIEESRSRLRVEVDTLRSLARVESKARAELGMTPPAANQVQIAREFVPSGQGLSMAAKLTASAEPTAPVVPGAR